MLVSRESAQPSTDRVPGEVVLSGFQRERHEKAWWMTPIVVVLLAMVAFILWAEASPVLPFIYTVF